VFTLNGGTIFAVGTRGGARLSVSSSKAGVKVGPGEPLTFTATVTAGGWTAFGVQSGTILFEDTFYPTSVATPVTSSLARVAIDHGSASVSVTGLAAGSHLITATHESTGTTAIRVQAVFGPGSPSVVAVEQAPEAAKQRAFFTSPAPQARHR
jgi:hypothetical protein